MNCLSCCSSTNSHDSGCRRRSGAATASAVAGPAATGVGSLAVIDAIVLAREPVAQAFRIGFAQAGDRHRAVATAGGVDHQRRQAVTPFQRTALEIEVLHSALR